MCHDESVPEDTDNLDSRMLRGAMGGVEQVGQTVRRRTGHWTPAVHELLAYLNDQGLRCIPRAHGISDDGREILDHIEGRGVPIDDEIVLDHVLVEAVTWLREFHDVVEGFRPHGERAWRGGTAELEPGQIICHNDPGAYNWVIQSGHFVAMIDWDLAGPGEPIDDLAFMLWTAIPLYRELDPQRVAHRVNLAVDAYGEWGPMTLLDAVVRRMRTAADRIEAGQARGDEGYLRLANVGEPQRTRDRVDAFQTRRAEIEQYL
jgi:hypothetical protein